LAVKRDNRLNWILQKMYLKGVVSVTELSEDLKVSVVTIRKDLKKLEEQGAILQVTGGAVLRQQIEDAKEADAEKKSANLELKHAVAKKAAELFIQDGDSLIVTSGMTPYLTLKYAENCSGLKILTDSLLIAEKLCKHPGYQMILFGGEVNERDSFVYGRDTVLQASRYMADKVIVTMDGIHPEAGLTALRSEGADTLKAILSRARKRILVADSTKLGVESFCNIGDISYADILVTNPTKDPEKQKVLKKVSDAGVMIVYADEQ